MREGLYRVQFQTALGAGAGVVHFRSGKLHGGDTGMFYVGTYELDGDKIVATLVVDAHNKSSVVSESVFGIDRANITLNGTVEGERISATGSAVEVPGLTFNAELGFLSD